MKPLPTGSVAVLGLLLAAVTAAQAPEFEARELRRISRLSPLPAPPPDPGNAVADDPRAVELGRRLFFDADLSASGDMSCASCHMPSRGWSNGETVSDPEAPFPRNVPSLRDTAHNRWFYWDGRNDSAWSQALGPLEDEREMATNRLTLAHRIRRVPAYREAYEDLFGPLPAELDDPARFPSAARPVPDDLEHPLQRAWATMALEDREAANRVFVNLGKAIAAFERTITSAETPFDRFASEVRQIIEAEGGPTLTTDHLSESAQRGLRLFLGRAQCILCHHGPRLTDGEFHDLGLALGFNMKVDSARYVGVRKLLQNPFNRNSRWADTEDPMAPVRFIRPKTHQLGQFKTPSLRGLNDTAPYMHDGRFTTLEEVVRFYADREGANPLGHRTNLLQPLDLTESEIQDLVAFLNSLSPDT